MFGIIGDVLKFTGEAIVEVVETSKDAIEDLVEEFC